MIEVVAEGGNTIASVLTRITAEEFIEIADNNLKGLIESQQKVIDDLEINSPDSVGQLSSEIIYKTCLQYTQGYINALGHQLIKDNPPDFRMNKNENSESSNP